MKIEIEEKIYAEFPNLFVGNDIPNSPMKFGCCCCDGWEENIRDACKMYQKWEDKYKHGLFFVQVKEKFGQLNMRWTFTNKEKLDDKALKALWKIDEEVLEKSIHTCEFCGITEDDSIDTRTDHFAGWVRTLCEPCRQSGKTLKHK